MTDNPAPKCPQLNSGASPPPTSEARLEKWLADGTEFLEDPKRLDLMKRVLTSEIDREVRSHFERTAKWWLGFTAVIVTVLGFGSYANIRSAIIDIVQQMAEKEIANAEKKVQVAAEDLKVQALVDYYMLSLKKLASSGGSEQRPQLYTEDRNYLISWLCKEGTPSPLFAEIVRVVVSCRPTDDARGDEHISTTLRRLLVADDPSVAWMRRSPEKRVAIIESIINEGSGYSWKSQPADIQRVLVEKSAPAVPALEIAALKYAGLRPDKSFLQTCKSIYLSKDKGDDVKRAALLAIASIDSESKPVAEWMQQFKSNKTPKDEEIEQALALALAIAPKNSLLGGGSDDPASEFEKRLKTSSSVLEAAFAHVDYLWVNGDGRRNQPPRVSYVPKSPTNIKQSYRMNLQILFSHDRILANRLLEDKAQSLKDFATLLWKLTLRGDGFGRQRSNAAVWVNVVMRDASARVILQNGSGNGQVKAPIGARLFVVESGAPARLDIKASWRDAAGLVHEEGVDRFENADKMQFDLNWEYQGMEENWYDWAWR